ncbi:MAG TPA: hypothetical protein VGM32_18540 [Rhodopila sp.]
MPGLTLGVDAYCQLSNNLIDGGQFGAPIILTAFNYAHGQQSGVEWTVRYDHGPLSLYGNLAYSRAMGKDINPAQYNSSACELAFTRNNWIHRDHDQLWSASAGGAYIFNKDSVRPTRVSVDLPVQVGLREHGDHHHRCRAAFLCDDEPVRGPATPPWHPTEF